MPRWRTAVLARRSPLPRVLGSPKPVSHAAPTSPPSLEIALPHDSNELRSAKSAPSRRARWIQSDSSTPALGVRMDPGVWIHAARRVEGIRALGSTPHAGSSGFDSSQIHAARRDEQLERLLDHASRRVEGFQSVWIHPARCVVLLKISRSTPHDGSAVFRERSRTRSRPVARGEVRCLRLA